MPCASARECQHVSAAARYFADLEWERKEGSGREGLVGIMGGCEGKVEAEQNGCGSMHLNLFESFLSTHASISPSPVPFPCAVPLPHPHLPLPLPYSLPSPVMPRSTTIQGTVYNDVWRSIDPWSAPSGYYLPLNSAFDKEERSCPRLTYHLRYPAAALSYWAELTNMMDFVDATSSLSYYNFQACNAFAIL